MGSRNNRGRGAEEECQDKACSDAKSSWKSFMKSQVGSTSKPADECPLDRERLGYFTWSLLHTIAAKYPMRPTTEQKSEMGQFIKILSKIYPCTYCAEEFREDIKKTPPQLESRDDLAQWFCEIHNNVNDKLNKPKFDCSKVDERWRTGWKDGSCL